MEVTVRHRGAVKFEVSARRHTITCDQPASHGGSDSGFTPPELLLASLGTCAAYYAVAYMSMRGLPTEDLSVRVTAEKNAQPARIKSFRIELESPELDQARHREGVIRRVQHCLVHNTLLEPPHVEIAVVAPATMV